MNTGTDQEQRPSRPKPAPWLTLAVYSAFTLTVLWFLVSWLIMLVCNPPLD
jgi:hypothetical protein